MSNLSKARRLKSAIANLQLGLDCLNGAEMHIENIHGCGSFRLTTVRLQREVRRLINDCEVMMGRPGIDGVDSSDLGRMDPNLY